MAVSDREISCISESCLQPCSPSPDRTPTKPTHVGAAGIKCRHLTTRPGLRKPRCSQNQLSPHKDKRFCWLGKSRQDVDLKTERKTNTSPSPHGARVQTAAIGTLAAQDTARYTRFCEQAKLQTEGKIKAYP